MLKESLSLMAWGAAALAAAQTSSRAGHFDPKDCVDPSGMKQCYADVETKWSACYKACGGGDDDAKNACSNSCLCASSRETIACAAESFWNQAYSCEYQQSVIDSASRCGPMALFNVPFFPPPDDAPAACSCNIGKMHAYINRFASEEESPVCEDAAKGLKGLDDEEARIEACQCCRVSGALSALPALCPSTDSDEVEYDVLFYQLTGGDTEWLERCKDIMERVPCGKDGLNVLPPGNVSSATFYPPGEVPKQGTESTSNMAGTVMAPPSGATFTWEVAATSYTVTPGEDEDEYMFTVPGITRTIEAAGTKATPGANKTEESKDKDNSEGQGDGQSGGGQSAASTLLTSGPLVVLAFALAV